MLKIIIVDDDEKYIQDIRDYLVRYEEEYHQEVKCAWYLSGMDFLDHYKAESADIVIMDIRMNGMDGMETAKELRKIDPYVCLIFITSMPQFALKSYEVSALDYVVKPIGYFNLVSKIQKAISYTQARHLKKDVEIWVYNNDGEAVRLYLSDVRYIAKDKNYLLFHTKSETYKSRGAMKNVEEEYCSQGFLKCISGILVNVQYITKISKTSVCIGDVDLPIGRPYQKEFLMKFMEICEVKL